MSTRPLESWAGLRRTCTVVQISRGSSRRQIFVRITIGGQAHADPEATCAKKLTCSPTGRASILKKGLVSHDVSPLKESCLIWWMTVRQSWRPATGTSCGQSLAILKEKRYHTSSPNFTSSPAPGRAVGSHLNLRPLAGHDAARLRLHRRRARALAVAAV